MKKGATFYMFIMKLFTSVVCVQCMFPAVHPASVQGGTTSDGCA